MGQRRDVGTRKMRSQIPKKSEPRHARAVPMRGIGDPPLGLHRGHVRFGERRFDQDMGAIYPCIEKTDRRNIHARPFRSFRQLLADVPLLIAVDIVKKEGWAVACPAKLDNGKTREQHQLDRCPVGQNREHDMFGKVQALLAIGRARSEPDDQLPKLILQRAHAPDLPPHLLAWRRKSRWIVGPKRLETSRTDGLDRFHECLALWFTPRRQLALLILTENLREYLARLIGNIQPDGPFLVRIEPRRPGLDAIVFSFDDIDPGSPPQLDFEKSALRRVQTRIFASCRIEGPIGGGKLAA